MDPPLTGLTAHEACLALRVPLGLSSKDAVMTSRIRVKMGQLEVECEGSEEFLRDELPKLIAAFSELRPPAQEQPHLANGNSGSSNGVPSNGASEMPKSMTTKTIAARLKCTSGPELMIAAAAQLTIVQSKDAFTRKDLLGEMRAAGGYFKQTMVSNFQQNSLSLIKSGDFHEVKKGEYSLSPAKLDEVKAQIA